MENNQSEVARVRQQITIEYEAGKAALYGISQGTLVHAIINNKLERMACAVVELVAIAGEDAAMNAIRELK